MKALAYSMRGRKYQILLRGQADKSVLTEIFELGEYQGAETIIKSAKYPIIDAGAQAGFFILYCRALNPEVKIYALEPDEANVELLNRHLELNKVANVEVITAVLAGQSGLRDFYLSKDTHNHSLNKDHLVNIAKKIKVQGISLSDFFSKYNLAKIGLFKLDIEGAEYEVLNSLSAKDWRKIEAIILEYHDWGENNHAQLEKLLQENNFTIKTSASKFDKNLGFIFGENKKRSP